MQTASAATSPAPAVLALTPRDLHGYAVAVGPGSFTGLRVGLSTVQGLALASGRPCLGVSALDLLAARMRGAAPHLAAMIDASRGEVFAVILSEAALVGIVATALGLGLGVVLAHTMLGFVARTINDLYVTLAITELVIQPLSLVRAAALGLGGTLLATLAPAFEAEGVCWSAYRTLSEASKDDSLFAANPVFGRAAQPSGIDYPVPGPAATLAGQPRGAPVPAPRLGANTDEVLADLLGMSSGEIGRLHDAGLVRGPGDAG